jgi:4-hydroxybutyrate CoA-transferase
MSYQAWQEEYRRKCVSFQEAAQAVKSGDFISIAIGVGGCSAELYEAILDRHEDLRDVKIMECIQLRPQPAL